MKMSKFSIDNFRDRLQKLKDVVVKLQAISLQKDDEISKLNEWLATSRTTIKTLQQKVHENEMMEHKMRNDHLKCKEGAFKTAIELTYLKTSFQEVEKETKELREKVKQLEAELEASRQEKNDGEEILQIVELEFDKTFASINFDEDLLSADVSERGPEGSTSSDTEEVGEEQDASLEEAEEVTRFEDSTGQLGAAGKSREEVMPHEQKSKQVVVVNDAYERRQREISPSTSITTSDESDMEAVNVRKRLKPTVGDDEDVISTRGKIIQDDGDHHSEVSVASSLGSRMTKNKQKLPAVPAISQTYKSNVVHAVDESKKNSCSCICGRTLPTNNGLVQHIRYYTLKKASSKNNTWQ